MTKRKKKIKKKPSSCRNVNVVWLRLASPHLFDLFLFKLVRTPDSCKSPTSEVCIILFYLFSILAVCKDEEGSLFLTKDENGLQRSHCMDCHCKAGFLTCRRNLTINFPGYYYGFYVHNENCAQPQCNVAKFVREKIDHCEGNKSPSLHLLIILLLE